MFVFSFVSPQGHIVASNWSVSKTRPPLRAPDQLNAEDVLMVTRLAGV
jgi:hypothetical protein